MASIKDVINKYQSQSAPDISATRTVAGTGAATISLATEFANAQKFQALRMEAGANEVDSQLLEQQRKQASLQREEQLKGLRQQGQQEREKYAQASDKIIADLENSRGKLTVAETIDKMEVAAAQLRLQDDKYRFELMDVGRRRRLDDAVGFDEALKQSIFSEEWGIFTRNLQFKKMLDMDESTFQKALSNISVADALDLAKAKASTASTVAAWSAGGSAVVTGIGMYQNRRPSTTTPESSAGGDSGNRQAPGGGVLAWDSTLGSAEQQQYGYDYGAGYKSDSVDYVRESPSNQKWR